MATDTVIRPVRVLDYDLQSRKHSEVRYLSRVTAANGSATRTLYEVTRADLEAVRRLVNRLFRTPRQSAIAAAARRLDVVRRDGRSMLAGSHPLPAALGAPRTRTTHLSTNLSQLSAALDRWFDAGEVVPAAAAERVQIILRRSGLHAWEKAFVAIFCYHFDESFGRLYDGMRMRAVELGVYALPLHTELDYRLKA